MKIKISEKQLQKQIIDYLTLKKACVVKVNNGGIFNPTTGTWRTQREKGISDILACYNGYFIAIEVKSSGKKPTIEQQFFLKKVIDAGGFAIWTDTFEKVEDLINGI